MTPFISAAEAESFIADEREAKRALYAKGMRAHKAKLPVFRLQGPLPPLLPYAYSKHRLLGVGHRHYG